MSARTRAANRRYGIGTGIVLATVAALTFVVWYFRPPLPDAETLCPTTRPIEAHTVVIVDRTDRWNPAIGEELTNLLAHAQRNTARFEKFSIVSLDGSESTKPVFSVCNPGEPTFMTDLYRGRRYSKRDFDQKFVGAAEDVIAEMSAPGEAAHSPIVEYVHRWLKRDDFSASVPNRKLILISDMRQNSDRLNLYADESGAGLSQLVEDQFGEAGRDVTYDVYFVAHGRDYNLPEPTVRTAWERAFAALPAHYEWRRLD